jgi:hypothetical protein
MGHTKICVGPENQRLASGRVLISRGKQWGVCLWWPSWPPHLPLACQLTISPADAQAIPKSLQEGGAEAAIKLR